MEEFSLNNIPWKVQEVWVWSMIGYCGAETMDRIQATIKKYPEYFPWETKYGEIPQDVHDTYYKEKYGERKPLWEGNEGGKGIWELIHEKSTSDPDPPKDLVELMKRMFENQDKMRKEKEDRRLKNKELWDKYYSKYKLEYRGK